MTTAARPRFTPAEVLPVSGIGALQAATGARDGQRLDGPRSTGRASAGTRTAAARPRRGWRVVNTEHTPAEIRDLPAGRCARPGLLLRTRYDRIAVAPCAAGVPATGWTALRGDQRMSVCDCTMSGTSLPAAASNAVMQVAAPVSMLPEDTHS